jgi:hypothetical protein
MTHATTHPWQGLTDSNGYPVVTEDGQRIRINPTTKQLTDNFGWALFNTQTGYPIVYIQQDIVTIPNMAQQTVNNGTLTNAITVMGLLNTGVEFYMGSIDTQYGSFDVPVFANNGGWIFTNGESADEIINEMEVGGYVKGQTPEEVWESIKGIFSGENGTLNNFMRVVGIVAAVIVVILLLPIIIPVLKIIAIPFVLLGDSLKKKRKGGNNGKESA